MDHLEKPREFAIKKPKSCSSLVIVFVADSESSTSHEHEHD